MKKHGTNKKNKTPGRTAIDPPINSFHSGPGGDTDTHTTKETPLKEENRVQFRQVHYVESKQQQKKTKKIRDWPRSASIRVDAKTKSGIRGRFQVWPLLDGVGSVDLIIVFRPDPHHSLHYCPFTTAVKPRSGRSRMNAKSSLRTPSVNGNTAKKRRSVAIRISASAGKRLCEMKFELRSSSTSRRRRRGRRRPTRIRRRPGTRKIPCRYWNTMKRPRP